MEPRARVWYIFIQSISVNLIGEANDYVGKGLSGGRITIAPPRRKSFKPDKNIIVGNTVLYSYFWRMLYIWNSWGKVCRRNSGAIAVVGTEIIVVNI